MPGRHPRRVGATLLLLGICVVGLPSQAQGTRRRSAPKAEATAEPVEYRLVMSKAVACESVEGFGDYVERPSPRLSADEKLLVYYEPRHFATEKVGGRHRAHLTQDARMRKRGQKAAVWSKDKILDYEAKADTPAFQLFLSNTIALKGLPPGDYDLDITLHDEIGKGSPATQTLRFSIVEPPEAADEADPAKSP